MPISRTGKIYYTKAQLQAARQRSALEYARAVGYNLVRHSATAYHLKEHDSMVFTADGFWNWNSRDLHGRALEFIMHYEGRSLPMAVHILTSGDSPYAASLPAAPPAPVEKKPFELPEKAPSFRRLFAYLCNTRKLDVEIVQELVHQHRLYESIQSYTLPSTSEVRTAHNAVFVGMDDQGIPRSAFQRGLNPKAQKPFKLDVDSSDKRYAFCCQGYDTVDTVAVFEAAIDAISHATFEKHCGRDWHLKDRISLGGVGADPIFKYLETHLFVRKIELCLDADAKGLLAAGRIWDALLDAGYTPDKGYSIKASIPPAGKDWNEYWVMYYTAKGGDTA